MKAKKLRATLNFINAFDNYLTKESWKDKFDVDFDLYFE